VRELQFFQQIVERKNTIPILANVLIEATGNEITLLATDLEVTLRSRAEAAVSRHGAVTLPAKKLYEVVRALPDGDVNIETEKGGSGVKVSGGQFSSRMPTASSSGTRRRASSSTARCGTPWPAIRTCAPCSRTRSGASCSAARPWCAARR